MMTMAAAVTEEFTASPGGDSPRCGGIYSLRVHPDLPLRCRLHFLASVFSVFACCEGVSVSMPLTSETSQFGTGEEAVTAASKPFLYFVESQKQGVAGVDGLISPTKVVVSPDGRNVYAACYASSAVVVFRRDVSTGALKFVETQRNGVGGVTRLGGAYDVAVSPDGENVYVVTVDDNSLVVFSRNATTGALTFVEAQRNGIDGVDGLVTAKSVKVSLDGHHVYAVGYGGSSLAAFSRSATTGTLKFVQVVKNGVNGVTGLAAVNSIDLSPDGRNVYAIAAGFDAVTVFARDTNTGMLSFVELQKQGINGVDGLSYAYCVTASSDGLNVYAIGTSSNAIAVFRRSTATGALTFLEVHKDGIGGVDGLAGAKSLSVSPSGEYVYVAGPIDNAVAVFSRDQRTGALAFVEAQKNGINGVTGLTFAYGVTVSPDNQNIYATALRDDAIVVFRVPAPPRRRIVRGTSEVP